MSLIQFFFVMGGIAFISYMLLKIFGVLSSIDTKTKRL